MTLNFKNENKIVSTSILRVGIRYANITCATVTPPGNVHLAGDIRIRWTNVESINE